MPDNFRRGGRPDQIVDSIMFWYRELLDVDGQHPPFAEQIEDRGKVVGAAAAPCSCFDEDVGLGFLDDFLLDPEIERALL